MSYHVACDPNTNAILAGTVNKKGNKWVNKTEVTEEALAAVRDHFLRIAEKENLEDVGYRWTKEDGKSIVLKIEFVDQINEGDEQDERA